MEKRVLFRSAWLPWLLLLPQMAIIGIFFFWPAAQAILQGLARGRFEIHFPRRFTLLMQLLRHLPARWRFALVHRATAESGTP